MNALLFHFASGDSLFTGLALAILGVASAEVAAAIATRRSGSTGRETGAASADSRPSRGLALAAGAGRFAAVVGAAFAFLSSAPLPWPLWSALAAGWLGWLALAPSGRAPSSSRKAKPSTRAKTLFRCVVIAVLLLAAFPSVMRELRWRRAPAIDLTGRDRFVVIGDSLSAGLLDNETTWPTYAAESLPIPVVNVAYPGATLASAFDQLRRMERGGRPLVFLMIGGNDLLADGASADAYRSDLDALLAAVRAKAGPEGLLVMMEMPLPPLFWRFGHAQREVAARHGVKLLPKRLLAGVLAPPENTTDGLHLTEEGKRAMANAVETFFVTPD